MSNVTLTKTSEGMTFAEAKELAKKNQLLIAREKDFKKGNFFFFSNQLDIPVSLVHSSPLPQEVKTFFSLETPVPTAENNPIISIKETFMQKEGQEITAIDEVELTAAEAKTKNWFTVKPESVETAE